MHKRLLILANKGLVLSRVRTESLVYSNEKVDRWWRGKQKDCIGGNTLM